MCIRDSSWREAVTLAEASIRRAAALGASEELAGLHEARARGLDAGGHRTDAVAAWRASVTATPLDDVARRADRLRRLAELEWTEGLFAAAGGSIAEAAAPVSYTHLDVYKRQVLGEELKCRMVNAPDANARVSSRTPFAAWWARTCLLYTSRCV